ncbi:MAG: hypothetical protein EBY55_02325 [Gammaproteobacteria bacterium]|nr:hypothetical protein [Gammaproteobacteria bacterium]
MVCSVVTFQSLCFRALDHSIEKLFFSAFDTWFWQELLASAFDQCFLRKSVAKAHGERTCRENMSREYVEKLWRGPLTRLKASLAPVFDVIT